MFCGTASDVGKSLIVAGLGRAFVRRGLRVLPFKPQNMSNNAAVTADGGEIGRAQALQARACGVAPLVDMNPVLLKPQSASQAQVVVHGKVCGIRATHDLGRARPDLMQAVLESYRRLADDADLILVEGAGSPAEVNLRRNDIANLGFARAAHVPVVLIGDIERGGVIASIAGTMAVLDREDAAHIRAFLINKFRGDVRLFADGVRFLEQHTGLRHLGVVPFDDSVARLPSEDTVRVQNGAFRADDTHDAALDVVIPLLSRISNFDEFDALVAEPEVRVTMVPPGRALPPADVVILPGTKATVADIQFLRAQHWDVDIAAHVRRGGAVFGVCGGYQMLGHTVRDPKGIEGPPAEIEGLGLLDVETTLLDEKVLQSVSGTAHATGTRIDGYKMHVGTTTGPGCARPLLDLAGTPDGAISADGLVEGCSVHGLFASDTYRAAWMAKRAPRARSRIRFDALLEETIDRWAHHLERHLDLDAVLEMARSAPM